MTSTNEPQSPCPKRNKRGTKPCFCSEQHREDPCHHGTWGGLSRVTQACAAHAPAQQKKRTAVQDRWILAGLSAESLESLTSKETNNHPSHLSLSILLPQSRPPKKKNTQNNNKFRQLHKSCTVKARPTATTSGLCPAPHPRT